MREQRYRHYDRYAEVIFPNSVLDTSRLNELFDRIIMDNGAVHINETRKGQYIKLEIVVNPNERYERKTSALYIYLENERGEKGPQVTLRYRPRIGKKSRPYRDAIEQLEDMVEGPVMEDVEHLELVSA